MDPNACLKLIQDYVNSGDTTEAYYVAQDLNDWLNKQGATPIWANYPIGAAYYGRFLAGNVEVPDDAEEYENIDELMESNADLETKFNFLLDN